MNTPEVLSIGGILVEIMRQKLEEPLYEQGTFAGPFPSCDTPIYIDAVARLGRSAGYIGAVGKDDFGKCVLDRFERDGIDFSFGRVLPNHTTGVAFVAYFNDGSRKFIYHWRHAAAGQLSPEYINKEYINNAKWLHLTGCNLAASPTARDACYKSLEYLSSEAKLSFDANIRPELLSIDEIRELCAPVINRANVLFPSLGESQMLTGAKDDEEGCRLWAEQGKLVVLKQGPKGCRIFHEGTDISVPGFEVNEVDPTGAGDAFCGGFTVALLDGLDLLQAGRFANAVGAFAVTKLGPMEGNPTRSEVEIFLLKHPYH
jgi:sugar/nucleoside kinase (ribokinase family)